MMSKNFGGFRLQDVDPEQQNPPDAVKDNQLVATVEGYKQAVLAAGIPFRQAITPLSEFAISLQYLWPQVLLGTRKAFMLAGKQGCFLLAMSF